MIIDKIGTILDKLNAIKTSYLNFKLRQKYNIRTILKTLILS